jgi:serine/threonine protein kinase/Flp pilus assembly protein TadD
LERVIAVKILHPLLANDEQYINLLKREVVISSQLSHPNIVRVFDVGKFCNNTVIAMAFVQGESLASILRREGALSMPRVVHFCQQICSGLAEAHRRGVVHRDLKPQNILVDTQNQLFIADFGLAHSVITGNFEVLESSSRNGTLLYMSPEQVHALPAESRSDLFSFGLILYEMLTGNRLEVDHHSTGTVALDRKTGLPVSLAASVSAPLAAIALRCLARNPAERFQSAAEVLEALPQNTYPASCSGRTGTLEGSPTPAPPTMSRIQIRRTSAVAAFSVVLLAGISILWFQNSDKVTASGSFDRLCREASSELAKREDVESVRRAAKMFQAAAALRSTGFVYQGIAKAKFRLFELKSDRQDLSEARSALQRAERLSATDRSLGLLHAEIDMADRMLPEALMRLKRILSLEGPSDEVLRLIAKAQFLAGNSAESLTTWEHVVKMNPHFWVNHNGFGAALMAAGQPERAAGEFRKVIELNSESYVGYANIGAAFVATGEFNRAITATEKSLTLRPTPSQFNNLGTALYYTGSCFAAIQLFRRALELKPKSELYEGNLGEAYRCAGDSENAEAAYVKALKLAQELLRATPNDTRLQSRLSVYLAKTGQVDEAQRRISSVAAASPNNPEVLYCQAIVYLIANQFARAVSAVQGALAVGYSIRVAARDPELKPLWRDLKLGRIFRAELNRVELIAPASGSGS